VTPAWLGASAAVALLGAWAIRLAHVSRRPGTAVCAVALVGLLVSPVSWSHHWVWVVPLGVAAAVEMWPVQEGRRGRQPDAAGPVAAPADGTPADAAPAVATRAHAAPGAARPEAGPPAGQPTARVGAWRSPALAAAAVVAVTWWAPYRDLPVGGDVELTWPAGQQLLGALLPLAAVAFLVAVVVTGRAGQPPLVRQPAGAGRPSS
jgi:alpha-1,2-mannosyltransferase